ncbi:class I SAM-dependent RNA methyltransferase [Curvibacter sp. CHRR-16]|uniref:THUMP domain-containing class I SAM-dependent RNA methyltransferase n=1 Tax=Curvibacter sp. CHRR-16 TaxID=2835872 RepID=UPI001BD94AAE|nr:THUMP domain-containing protein [Curvibacter sp. CHRR-16]MBT0569694.1 class I SAM-dependent RNA methyltransferase [Curvibacter sp. CHRR-16]
MNLQLFLPCAAGVEEFLATEIRSVVQLPPKAISPQRGGVRVNASWNEVMLLNLHSRLAQRVLVLLSYTEYRTEQDIYRAGMNVPWEQWFTPRQSIKVEITAQHSPLQSLNFAALRVKDAVCDRFRETSGGVRPDVDTQRPDVRIFAHLTTDACSLYLDTSGEPLFKRGWREDKGDAPLKETLAAAMLYASGWVKGDADGNLQPLYDPCCGSGTIVIEAAQMACGMAPGLQRPFAFTKLRPYHGPAWQAMKSEAQANIAKPDPGQAFLFYGSDVSHRMVDFAQRNADRAGVGDVIEFRGGDALQRMPPVKSANGGVMMLNPPYGERIGVGGVAKTGARELVEFEGDGSFFEQLSAHWKKNFTGWTAWMLTPDLKLPGRMRLKESRRVPMWNGPLECRLFRFDMVAGRLDKAKRPAEPTNPDSAQAGDAA